MANRSSALTNTGFPSVDVVICTRDRPDYLESCLQAASKLEYPCFRLLVVDNAPTADSAKAAAQRWGAEYVLEPEPGLARARNCAARHCTSEIIAYLDDDARPQTDWLQHLVAPFSDPEVMAVTGRMAAENVADEQLWIEAGGTPGGGEDLSVDRTTPGWLDLVNRGRLGSGCNMAFRRSAFSVWPGFDPRLDRGAPLDGGGENYAFFRLIDKGYRIAYAARAVVVHRYPSSDEELRDRYRRALVATGGYLTLLFCENRQYRRDILRNLWHQSKPTRGRAGRAGQRRILPKWKAGLLAVRGALIYLKLRLRGGTAAAPSPRSA